MTDLYRLGIDTGGTYTDAVIVNTMGDILATSKQLTTHGNLSEGIAAAISSVPSDMLQQVRMVTLSTTLSTNSVVEGRGGRVCVILPGYSQAQVQQSGLLDILDSDCIHMIGGGHSATGEQMSELDIDAATRIVEASADTVSAYAVSALFATRNAEHEYRLAELIQHTTKKPVVCGHQLAHALHAPRRALTTALNARMIQPIEELILAVEYTLRHNGIDASIMIVNGDGSLVNTQMALTNPIATMLSGPAASVTGACQLTGVKDAIVVDIGGTTTDIAIAKNGKVQRSHDGARIGDWKPLVDAIRVCAVGLGGDSEARFNGGLSLDGRRVLPISLLSMQHPAVKKRLERQLKGISTARQNKFAVALRPQADTKQFTKQERMVWASLLEGPLELEALAETSPTWGRTIARLERRGLVIYSGFTPTDASHVLGLSDHWDNQAAELAAKIWAKQMRYLYGFGSWEIGDAISPSKQLYEFMVEKICEQVINACLHQQLDLTDKQMATLSDVFTSTVLGDRKADNPAAVLKFQFDPCISMVGVGGSAHDYLPEVARRLGLSFQIPEHASIANAIGSVFGEVVQTVRVFVSQPTHGVFMVFYQDTPLVFDTLNDAMEMARKIASRAAVSAAQFAGGANVNTTIDVFSDHVHHDIDGELFVNATVMATATGKPLV